MSTATVSVPTTGGLSGVLRSEVRKFLSTRLWWIMALCLAGYVAFLAVTLSFALFFDPEMAGTGADLEAPSARESANSIYTLAPAFGYVFPLIVGALSVTAEFRHQTITPTLLAEPRRGRLLGAKLISGLPVGAAIGALGSITCWAAGATTIALMGGESLAFTLETLRVVALSALALAIWTMVGVGFGALIPNQIGSITVALAFTQFVEPIARLAMAQVDSLAPATKFLPGAAGEAIAGGSFYGTMSPVGMLPWWGGGLVLIGYALLFGLIGLFTTFRKDVG
ncbi:MAG TPA: hypothetical protein VK030_02440 [Actinomycetales bacterium]|nr:hypothetical protein [Actinomycetales bacterium]